MSISEFNSKVNLIITFVNKVNAAAVPDDIKKIMVKAYASTLSINLSDRMAERIIDAAKSYPSLFLLPTHQSAYPNSEFPVYPVLCV